MGRYLNTAVRMVFVTLLLFGLVYPLMFTGIAQVLFPQQANGSLLKRDDGTLLGSALIGQPFSRPEYFHSRPSAATSSSNDVNGYDATNSGGSNLAPTSQSLVDRVSTDIATLTRENAGLKRGNIPVDMVTTSASGLDPDITPANALAQSARVASARGATPTQLEKLIYQQIISRQFGILGEPRINVLALNCKLDKLYPMPGNTGKRNHLR